MSKLRGWPWILLIAGGFLSLVFLLAKFPPSETELLLRYAAWSKFSGVALPPNFAAELPFSLPAGILSLVTWAIPMSLFWFRAVNLAGILIWLVLVRKLTREFTGGWFLIFSSTSLWIVWTTMSSLPAVLTLLLVTGLLLTERIDYPKRNITQAFFGLWLALTSFSGWIFSVIFLIHLLKTKFDWKTLGVGIFITGYGFLTAVIPYYRANLANTPIYIEPGLGERVDNRVRYEFRLNNYQDVVPLAVKRLVYNKPFFAYREVSGKIISQFSPERLAFPGQADATVARSLWGSKGLGWLAWWLLPVSIWGLFAWQRLPGKLRYLAGVLGMWGVLGLIFGNTGDFLENGIGICLALMLVAAGLVRNSGRWIKVIVAVMTVIWTIPSFYHFLYHEEIWRDNRPKVQLVMAQMGTRYSARQISTILGRSFLYFGWINRIPPAEFWDGVQAGTKLREVKFDHFEFRNQKPASGVYVGLPGEFLGNRARDNKNQFSPAELPGNQWLSDSFQTHDTVSFGNGDYVWAVEAK